MKKQYKEIEFSFGNIESAIAELKQHDGLVCGNFNGKMLYSDIDTVDSAYKKITGRSKEMYDQLLSEQRLEREKNERNIKMLYLD